MILWGTIVVERQTYGMKFYCREKWRNLPDTMLIQEEIQYKTNGLVEA
jgi:hypothetical protein